MDIIEELLELKKRYKMVIPSNYEEFIKNTNFFDYSGTVIKIDGIEIEINHFLKVDPQNPSRDVLNWYTYAEKDRIDFLTIAMGFGNEEIAIKTRGDNLGTIYYIDQTESVMLKKLFCNFNELQSQLI